MRDLDLLDTFLEIYRSGSLTAAASRQGLSQPSVSERLARLETQLGSELFARSSRGVTPTVDGDRLAAQIGDGVDRLRQVWETASPPVHGIVRLAGASDVMARRIIPALAPLIAGGMTLEVSLGLTPELLSQLVEGEVDVVVASARAPLRGVRYQALVDEEFVLVGTPAHARTIDQNRAMTDPQGALAHLPLVAYDQQLSIIRRYWRSQFGVRPANYVAVIVPDLRAILAAVIAGAGVSVLPRYLADQELANGTVVVLHEGEDLPINTLYLATRTSADVPAPVRAAIAHLQERAQGWQSGF